MIKVKNKFKVGDKVIIKDYPHPGQYSLSEVIRILVNQDRWRTRIFYTLREFNTDFCEERLESFENFNKEQKAERMDYKSYIDWLNKQDFTKTR